jgi:hypothetical protein
MRPVDRRDEKGEDQGIERWEMRVWEEGGKIDSFVIQVIFDPAMKVSQCLTGTHNTTLTQQRACKENRDNQLKRLHPPSDQLARELAQFERPRHVRPSRYRHI